MPPRRTVIAYHVVWTAYGTWLPNDPRGSGSNAVSTPSLADLGQLHYGRKPVQPSGQFVRAFYHTAEARLKFSVVRFTARQIASIGLAFADTIHRHRYTCYACAIMPDHIHLVLRKHRDRAETMIASFQCESREALWTSRLVPNVHPLWTTGGWKSFLDSPDSVRGAIKYVQNNPAKADRQSQSWQFVTQYDGWPLHRRTAK